MKLRELQNNNNNNNNNRLYLYLFVYSMDSQKQNDYTHIVHSSITQGRTCHQRRKSSSVKTGLTRLTFWTLNSALVLLCENGHWVRPGCMSTPKMFARKQGKMKIFFTLKIFYAFLRWEFCHKPETLQVCVSKLKWSEVSESDVNMTKTGCHDFG